MSLPEIASVPRQQQSLRDKQRREYCILSIYILQQLYMVFRALSDRVKRAKTRRTENAILQRAVDAYSQELAKPESAGVKKGVRTIAQEHGIPHQYKTILPKNTSLLLSSLNLHAADSRSH